MAETEHFKLADLLFAEMMKSKLNEWRSELFHGLNASSESSNGSTPSTKLCSIPCVQLSQSQGFHFSSAQSY